MNVFTALIFGFFLLATLLFADCRNQRIIESAAENNSNSTPKTEQPDKNIDDFEARLKAVKNGNFDYIFVFRRKDGVEITSDDKQFLKASALPEPNRWEVPGDNKAVIAGTNFPFPEKVLQNLRARFSVEDYSKQ